MLRFTARGGGGEGLAKYNKDKIRTRRGVGRGNWEDGNGKTGKAARTGTVTVGVRRRGGSGTRKSCRYLAGWPFFFLFLIRGGISQRNSSLSPQ